MLLGAIVLIGGCKKDDDTGISIDDPVVDPKGLYFLRAEIDGISLQADFDAVEPVSSEEFIGNQKPDPNNEIKIKRRNNCTFPEDRCFDFFLNLYSDSLAVGEYHSKENEDVNSSITIGLIKNNLFDRFYNTVRIAASGSIEVSEIKVFLTRVDPIPSVPYPDGDKFGVIEGHFKGKIFDLDTSPAELVAIEGQFRVPRLY